MNWLIKKKSVPESNNTKTIDVYQSWGARWQSRYSEWTGGIKPEAEFFLTEKEALDFKKSLKNAFELLKHTACNEVTIEKVK